MKHTYLFRKIVAIIVTLAIMLPVFACTPRQQVEATPKPSVAIETPEPDLNPYKGDGSEYVSIYTDERDKACEADVVKFADVFLNPYHGHPKLTDVDTTVQTYVTPFAHEDQLKNFFNPALRAEFLKRINELIFSIPDLTNFEIIARLAETVALLKDGHSWVYLPMEKQFPLELLLFPNETGVELYVNGTTDAYEDCLTARLDAINGVSINEIIERTKPFESYEAEPLLYDQARYNAINWNILNHIGVVDDSGNAVYSFTDASGNSFDKEIYTVNSQNEEDIKMIRYLDLGALVDTYEDDSLISMYDTSNFEYRYLKEDTVLYLRINSLWIDNGRDDGKKRIYDMFDKISDENKPIESIVVDFRQNGGGRPDLASALITQLNKYDESVKKYILISEVTYSAGIVSAACLRRGVSNAILVGSPGGAPATMFTAIEGVENNNFLKLPHLNTYYGAGKNLAVDGWPGYKEYTLMPDEVIYQTYEDYLNGVDTVLKALLTR